jgi:hypothetical protein
LELRDRLAVEGQLELVDGPAAQLGELDGGRLMCELSPRRTQ